MDRVLAYDGVVDGDPHYAVAGFAVAAALAAGAVLALLVWRATRRPRTLGRPLALLCGAAVLLFGVVAAFGVRKPLSDREIVADRSYLTMEGIVNSSSPEAVSLSGITFGVSCADRPGCPGVKSGDSVAVEYVRQGRTDLAGRALQIWKLSSQSQPPPPAAPPPAHGGLTVRLIPGRIGQ